MEKISISLQEYLAQSTALCSALAQEDSLKVFPALVKALAAHLAAGRPLLLCGNGGSAADAAHITAELVGRFRRRRQALNCLCLNDNPAVLSAWANDVGFESVFARGVEAYGKNGGVLLALSTSGNSANVLAAARQARAQGLTVVGFSGRDGGALAEYCDYLLTVPADDTAFIQQGHQCLYHFLCDALETALAQSSPLDP